MWGLKTKALEDELEELKKMLTVVCVSLPKDTVQLAEQAQSKSSTLMARMITNSNALSKKKKKKYRDKCNGLKNVEAELKQNIANMP